MKIIATYNIKGGVGKTSTAVNLAYLAARDGYQTLLWDLDPQGTASFCFRVKPKIKGGIRALRQRKNVLDEAVKATDFEGLDLIPADFSFRNFDQVFSDGKKPGKQLLRMLFPMSRQYDLLIIDSAPSISLIAENVGGAPPLDVLQSGAPTELDVLTLPDGRVEAWVEGPPEAVGAMLDWLADGPAHARVDALEPYAEQARGLTGFDLRRGSFP